MHRAKNDPRFKDGSAGVLDCRSSQAATVTPNELRKKQGGEEDEIKEQDKWGEGWSSVWPIQLALFE